MITGREAGFTLLEVMIALAVFAVMAAGFSAIVSNNIRTSEYLEARTTAAWIAEDKLNEYRVIGHKNNYQTRELKKYGGKEWAVELEIMDGGPFGTKEVRVKVGLKADAERKVFLSEMAAFI